MVKCDSDEKVKLLADLAVVDEAIAEIEAEENFVFVQTNVEHLLDNTENLNPIKMWELKKKLCGKKSEAPTAKRDSNGKLVTSHTELKKLFEDTYKNRLRNRTNKTRITEFI